MKRVPRLLLFYTFVMLCSCKVYKQDIMFKLDDDFTPEMLATVTREIEKNYVIQTNDYLAIDVFTNKGERVIDPNFELQRQQGNINQQRNQQREFQYLVQEDGNVKLPMLDLVKLEGLTLQEAETMLEVRYNEFYKDSYVALRFNNKRVIVLGATGGQVIPLANDNTTILEVIALAGGIPQRAKADEIRLIRGELNAPEVYMINLSTISGMTEAVQLAQPGDIIYIEPERRAFFEALGDILPVLTLLTSLLSLALVLQNLSN